MTAVISPDVKVRFFQCLWCHSWFDNTQFSSTDLESGPHCLICGDLLERIEVGVRGTAKTPCIFQDETAVAFWH